MRDDCPLPIPEYSESSNLMTYDIAVSMKLRLTSFDWLAFLGSCTVHSIALAGIGRTIFTSNWGKNLGAVAREKICGFTNEGKYIQ